MATVNYSGSLRYDMHGRKRKQSRTSMRKVKSVEVSGIHKIPDYDTHRSVSHREKYPSAPMTAEYKAAPDTSYKKEISSQYTVAIAYNKGAYQVVSNSDIKHIGK